MSDVDAVQQVILAESAAAAAAQPVAAAEATDARHLAAIRRCVVCSPVRRQ